MYHIECMRQYLSSGKRPVKRICPSCRQPFETPIPLFFDMQPRSELDEYVFQFQNINNQPTREDQEPDEIILPDISYYEENITTLQVENNQLLSKLGDLERIIAAYQRRCEAQEDAKKELERQILELSNWLDKLRTSNREKDMRVEELENMVDVYEKNLHELEEERNTLAFENNHYRSFRVTDEYPIMCFCY